MLSTKAFSLDIHITRILIHRASGCAWRHSHSDSTSYSETPMAPGHRSCTSCHPYHLQIGRKGQPCGHRLSDSKQPESTNRGHYLQTLMTSRNIVTRIARWPVHKKVSGPPDREYGARLPPCGLEGLPRASRAIDRHPELVGKGLLPHLMSRG